MIPKFKYDHGSHISAVRASETEPMIAVAGTSSVEVLVVSQGSYDSIATFHIGCRITAITWGNSTSPLSKDACSIQLAVATADFALHILSKSGEEQEQVLHFGGMSGHQGRINDLVFCGGMGVDAWSYLASVSDDKTLIIWDLHPQSDSTSQSPDGVQMEVDNLPLPTAYPIIFKHPLMSVCAHPSTSKELLISDCRGSVYLTDWRTEFPERTSESWHHPHIIELVEPYSMASSAMGISDGLSSSLAWKREDSDIVGAVCGPKFSIWDLSRLLGGKPNVSHRTFPHGGNRFRWSPNHPEYFAISARQSPSCGAIINIHNTSYPSAHPHSTELAPSPHYIHDFDFVLSQGKPRIAAAIAQNLVFCDMD